jgi:hypothetical protein
MAFCKVLKDPTVRRVVYDSDVEDAFVIHKTDGTIFKFEATPGGLYAFKPQAPYIAANQARLQKQQTMHKDATNLLVSTVKENRLGYTEREYQRAKLARRVYHLVGAPTIENFKHILHVGGIRNCDLTPQDVEIAEKIFGPDVSTLKGKSTRRKPKIVRYDVIAVPRELKQRLLELAIDIMFICSIPMLTAIDRTIKFRSLVILKSRKAPALYEGLDNVLRLYNGRGFYISRILCDGELQPLMEDVQDNMDITFNFAPAGEHVPEAERNNRTIQERFRTQFHRLPYKAIPANMIKTLAMHVTHQLNLFPVKGGASKYYSPQQLMGGPPLDFNKHCQIPFGAYVQANEEPSPLNTPHARTLDAIYLRPMSNIQGGHELMNLHNGYKITRPRVTELPVTPLVIAAVESLAKKQGFEQIKIKDRSGVLLHPADWTAGVDYDEAEAPQNDDDDDDDDVPDLDYHPNEDDPDLDDEDEEDDDGYDPIDEEELEGLAKDTETDPSPVDQNEPEAEGAPEEGQDEDQAPAVSSDEGTVETESSVRRSSRQREAATTMNIGSTKGQSYVQKKKVVVKEDHNQETMDPELEVRHNLFIQSKSKKVKEDFYTEGQALLIAHLMTEMDHKAANVGGAAHFAQQYILQKGLKKFGQKGSDAATKELKQLHDRVCFEPISIADMSQSEIRKSMEALMLLTEKRDGTIKGRMVYNGKPTREWLSREDSTSPTVSLESLIITAVIDAYEGRDVMTADVPNAFIQTVMPQPTDGSDDRVCMKITGVLVDLLCKLDPTKYGPYVVFEKGRKVLYVLVLRAIYGMLVASLLWYKKFRGDLEQIGFHFNDYDPCVANRMVNGKQHTIRFHVDDVKASHIDPVVNDKFDAWLNKTYGSLGEVKTTRGPIHDYLGMIFDYSEKGIVKIDMCDYVKGMLDDFPIKFDAKDTQPTPAADDLFDKGDESKLLSKEQAEDFHTCVAKGLFLCKRARPDIHPTIAVLCTRVKQPNESDWKKLIRLMKYLNGTRDDKLILSADKLNVVKWYVDTSFAVHPDFKSHTGGVLTLGRGALTSLSKKQKLNTRSSTEAELVGADDASTLILWTKLFMEAQGYGINSNVLYQDNKSTILLEKNGKKSSGPRTRALNIRYFFLTDQVEKGNVMIDFCPTDDMIADYMTKPLQGAKFLKFKKLIMGHD